MRLPAYFYFSAAFTLLLLACWAAWPSRNLHGNPSLEHLLAQCATFSGDVVRLYEGNGGATTNYWYTVTVTPRSFASERQILFAYGSPVLRGLTCGAEAVHIETDAAPISIPESKFAHLHERPRALWHNTERDVGTQPFLNARRALAAAFAVCAVIAFYLGRRSLPRAVPSTG